MRSLLFILVYFVALTALSSGLILVIRPDGSSLGLDLSMLKETPFHSFLVPGLLLIFIVGGIHLFAIFLSIVRHSQTYRLTLIAGIVLMVWIVVQFLLVPSYTWLYGFYLIIGMLVCLLSSVNG
jgi:hypothetical protein